jgi:hypothetical protein
VTKPRVCWKPPSARTAACQPESDDACLLVVARRDFDKATKLPEELVTEISRVTSLAQEEWAKAREANEYSHFAPWLERILDLQRRTAEALGYEDRLYDALLNQYEYGMTSAELDPFSKNSKQRSFLWRAPLANAAMPSATRCCIAIMMKICSALSPSEYSKIAATIGLAGGKIVPSIRSAPTSGATMCVSPHATTATICSRRSLGQCMKWDMRFMSRVSTRRSTARF